MRRLRVGEWTALTGALGLIVVLSLSWFGPGGEGLHTTGWAALGWLMVAMLVAAILGAVAIALTTVQSASPALPLAVETVTATWASVTSVVLLAVVASQPGLGAELSNAVVSVRLPAYLGLVCTALIAVGSWIAIGDERTDAPESAFTPPPPRAVPGT